MFISLQAIGDGGQGWGNAILYIFLSPIIRERLIGEWCGKCAEKLEDHLDGVGREEEEGNSVQFKAKGSSGSIRRVEKNGGKVKQDRDDSSESAPFLSGEKARGYNIRRYDDTTSATMTEGGFTGTDISNT